MFRLVQIALLIAIIIPNGMARAQTISKSMVDSFTECAISAFVENEFDLPNPDPERAFSRCATEEQRILSAISFMQSERTQRLAYALLIKRKADLKAQMLEIAKK